MSTRTRLSRSEIDQLDALFNRILTAPTVDTLSPQFHTLEVVTRYLGEFIAAKDVSGGCLDDIVTIDQTQLQQLSDQVKDIRNLVPVTDNVIRILSDIQHKLVNELCTCRSGRTTSSAACEERVGRCTKLLNECDIEKMQAATLCRQTQADLLQARGFVTDRDRSIADLRQQLAVAVDQNRRLDQTLQELKLCQDASTDSDTRLTKLQAAYDACREESKKLVSRLAVADADQARTEDLTNRLRGQIQKLERDNENGDKALRAAEAQAAQLQKALDDLRGQNTNCGKSLQALEAQVTQLQAQSAIREKALHASEAHVTQLQKTLADVQAQNANREKALRAAELQVAQLQSANGDETSRLRTSENALRAAQSQIADDAARLTQLQKDIGQLTAQLQVAQAYQTQLKSALDRNVRLQEDLTASQAANKDLDHQYKYLLDRFTNAAELVAKLRQDLTNFQAAADADRAMIGKLQQALADEQAAKTQAQASAMQCQTEVGRLRTENAQLALTAGLDRTVTDLQAQLSTVTGQMQHYQSEALRLQNEVKALTGTLDALRQCREQAGASDTQIASLREKVTDLEVANVALQLANTDVMGNLQRVSQLEATNRTLTSQLQTCSTELAVQQQLVKQLTGQVTTLTAQVTALTTERDQLRTQLTRSQFEVQVRDQNLQKTTAARDAAISERDRAIGERDTAISERDTAIAERDRALQQASGLTTLEEQLTAAQKQVQTERQRADTNAITTSSVRAQVVQLTDRVRELERNAEEEARKLSGAEVYRRKAEEAAGRLREEKVALEKKAKDAESQCAVVSAASVEASLRRDLSASQTAYEALKKDDDTRMTTLKRRDAEIVILQQQLSDCNIKRTAAVAERDRLAAEVQRLTKALQSQTAQQTVEAQQKIDAANAAQRAIRDELGAVKGRFEDYKEEAVAKQAALQRQANNYQAERKARFEAEATAQETKNLYEQLQSSFADKLKEARDETAVCGPCLQRTSALQVKLEQTQKELTRAQERMTQAEKTMHDMRSQLDDCEVTRDACFNESQSIINKLQGELKDCREGRELVTVSHTSRFKRHH